MSAEPVRQLPPAPLVRQRVPPQDFDAEQGVIGSVLIAPDAAERALQIVAPEDFYWETHQHILRAVQSCQRRREPVDLITVSAELRRLSLLETVGGGTYLTACISSVPTAAHVVRYANIVRDKRFLRDLIATSARCASAAYENPEDPLQPLSALQGDIHRLVNQVSAGSGRLRTVAEAHADIDLIVEQAGAGRRPLSPARIGINGLDHRIGPFSDHRVCILGAKSGEGKTHVAVNAVAETCQQLVTQRDPGKVVVYSFESQGMYFRRLLAHISMIDSEEIRIGFDRKQQPAKWDKLQEAKKTLRSWPLLIKEQATSDEQIDAEVRSMARKYDIALIVIDHLQLMPKRRARKDYEEYDEAAKLLENMTHDLGCPLLLLSQVTHNQTTGKMQAKGSGGPEAISTLVMWLNWNQKRKLYQLTCSKTREGENWGVVDLALERRYSRISLLTPGGQAALAPEAESSEPYMAGGEDPFDKQH